MQTVSLPVHLTDRTVTNIKPVLSINCAVVCGKWKCLEPSQIHVISRYA